MQYPSHATGSLHFGPDGYLYASGGEGAHYSQVDHGQVAAPYWPGRQQPLRRPGPRGRVAALRRTCAPPVTRWACRARSSASTPTPVSARPATRSPAPGTRNLERIVAYGLRNPFRFAFRPGVAPTRPEVWVGDVGQGGFEEIDRFRVGAPAENFGWPCYEGPDRNPGFDPVDLPLCESLYDERSAAAPVLRLPAPGEARGRVVPRRLLVGLGRAVRGQPDLPGPLRRSAVLLRLLPPVHLGDEDRPRRAAGPGPGPAVPPGRCQPRRPADRPRRGPVLPQPRRRRLRQLRGARRVAAAHPLRRRQPDAHGGDRGRPHLGCRPAAGRARRQRLERRRRRRPRLRLGPRRRRPVRRRDGQARPRRPRRGRATRSCTCGSATDAPRTWPRSASTRATRARRCST